MTGLGTRLGLGAVGVVAGLYGAYLSFARGLDNLVDALIWLAGGVIVHDGVVGPLLILAGLGFLALVSSKVRAPVAAGLIVLGTVTVTAIPVLGRFGERPDNATLLDRNYTVGWLVLALLVVLATALGAVRSVRRTTPSGGPSDGDVVREPHDELPDPPRPDERA